MLPHPYRTSAAPRRPSRVQGWVLLTVSIASLAAIYAAEGCGESAVQVQARTANAVALAANAALPLLAAKYRADGLAIIADAPDRATAEARLDAHRRVWVGVWGHCDGDPPRCHDGAWPALREAHDAWATALERQAQGGTIDLAEALRDAAALRAAYCALRAFPPAAAALPQVPLAPCDAPAAAPPDAAASPADATPEAAP